MSAASGVVGLVVTVCVAQVGSLFSADSWHSMTFAAEEVGGLRRNPPRALAAGSGLVSALYLLANVSYLVALPVSSIQNAPDDRLLVLPRTRLRDAAGAPLLDPQTGSPLHGNLYGNLLDYVVFSVLIFFLLTTAGIFVLRRKRPAAERPYRAFGYPVLPALYIAAASVIPTVLLVYRTDTTWPGLLTIYLLWRRLG